MKKKTDLLKWQKDSDKEFKHLISRMIELKKEMEDTKMEKECITKEDFDKYKSEFWKRGFGKGCFHYKDDKTDSWNVWNNIKWLIYSQMIQLVLLLSLALLVVFTIKYLIK